VPNELNVVDIADFKRMAKEDKTDGLYIRKHFHTEIKEVDGNMTLQFAISSNTLDRDGDTIDPAGWNLENYRQNPVVLWAHDYGEPPVARSLKEWVDDEKLKSRAEFTPKELYPFGFMIFQMLKGGFLNTTSVGFRPEEWNFAEGAERKFGIDFKRQELLEYSVVPVPSNPQALIEARSVGIDTAPMLAWAEKVLDIDDSGIWLPRKNVEDIYKLLRPDKGFFDVSTENEESLMPSLEGAQKRGRVINAANEQKLRDARTLIDDVLGSVAAGSDEDEDDKGVPTPQKEEPDDDLEACGNSPAPNKDTEPVLELDEEPTLELDEDEEEETIETETLQNMVREIVQSELRELKMRLTGRVD
jgi:HK97 family phage prohead protease